MPGLHIPKYNEDAVAERPIPLRASSNVGGYATVFMGGGSPSFILKDSACLPRVVSLKGKWVKGLAAFSSRWCENGFAYVDASVSYALAIPWFSRLTNNSRARFAHASCLTVSTLVAQDGLSRRARRFLLGMSCIRSTTTVNVTCSY